MPRCQRASDRTVERTNEQGRKISGIDFQPFSVNNILWLLILLHIHRVYGQRFRVWLKWKKRVCFTNVCCDLCGEKIVSIFSSYWFYLVKYSMLGIEDFRAGFFLSKLQSSFFCHGIFILILYKFFSCDFYHFLEMIESRMAIEVEKGTEYSSLRQKRKRNTACVIVLCILVPLFLCVCVGVWRRAIGPFGHSHQIFMLKMIFTCWNSISNDWRWKNAQITVPQSLHSLHLNKISTRCTW